MAKPLGECIILVDTNKFELHYAKPLMWLKRISMVLY